jgi:DNA primase
MAGSSDIFRQVRSAVDIVDVIGEHLALKRAGREFKCLCPFHDDHKPSMNVVPHKQIFHCFVCGTTGDVFSFVEKYHKMTKGEALRMLAQRAGIKLPDLPGRSGQGPQRDKDGLTARERIANTNEWACDFFEKHLRTPLGKAGLDYFYARGLTDETLARFRLGMSPDSWTGLATAALRLGISNENLLEAGLVKQRQDGSPYDAFRNRVIFPIIDASGGGGRVIAFGGRVLVEKRDEAGNVVEAKYLNSPDTRLFNKSESLYGLNHARQQIIRTRTAVIVEGYMDVIACHQAGVTNVIATLGTALTSEHARILKNYAQTVVLVFDSDDAGRRAADRALEVFVRGSLDIKLTHVPDGKDPCDFCMKNGGSPFQKLIDTAADALTYKWQQLQSQFHSTTSVTARQEAVTTYLRFVAAALSAAAPAAPAIDPVRRGLLLSKVAGLVNMPAATVEETIKKLARTLPTPRPSAPVPPAAVLSDIPEGMPIEGDLADLSASAEPAVPTRIDIRTLKGLAAAEAWLLGAILVEPPLFERLRSDLALHLFQTFPFLAAALLEYFENCGDLADCTLPDILAVLQESSEPQNAELVRQAVELEARTADWLDPAHLSPTNAQLVQHLTADRGLSLESLARDSIQELQTARGQRDPRVEADFGDAQTPPPNSGNIDPEAEMMRQIQKIQQRNAAGGNRRVV